MSEIEYEIETSKVFTKMKNRLSELEKEIIELKQAKAIAQLNLDNSRLFIENERLHKENIALKEIKELFSRLNKEQSEAILELKMRIEEMESSSKHWDEIHRGSKIMDLDTANEPKTQDTPVYAKELCDKLEHSMCALAGGNYILRYNKEIFYLKN